MKTRIQIALFCVAVCCTSAAEAQTLEWIRQLGTSGDDDGFGVSADELGNVYIGGVTAGSLGGPYAGSLDAFLRKYDASGMLKWTRQLGTGGADITESVSCDGLGNVYISGGTTGSLGGVNAGDWDLFLAKYDAAGTVQWKRQLGTSSEEFSGGIAADRLGNVYISGGTNGSLGSPSAGGIDAFLAKYDATGTRQWTRQFGTNEYDAVFDLSADGLGNIFVSGTTLGSLGGPNPSVGFGDAFLSKYDDTGNLQWIRQIGTSVDENGNSVSADGLGNVYVAGTTRGSLGGPNAGFGDAFLSKYDDAGNLQWIRQFGTNSYENGQDVSADHLGNVYISGSIQGSPGGFNDGTFIGNYNADGGLNWIRQFDTSGWYSSHDISADDFGNVYITGGIGDPGGPWTFDAFVAKFSSVPEPSALFIVALAAAGIFVPRRRLGPDLKRGNSDRSALNYREKE